MVWRRAHRKGPVYWPHLCLMVTPFVPFDLSRNDSKEVISLTVEVHSGRDTTFTAFTEGKRLQFCSSATREQCL